MDKVLLLLILKKFINSASTYITLYLLLFFILNLLPFKIQKTGVFHGELNLVHLIKSKGEDATKKMHESNLGINFIANGHKLSETERQIFQSSGLIHLLAISGGQILPIVQIFCFIHAKLLFVFLRGRMLPHKIMKYISRMNIISSFIISFFISLIFGCTGALLRVSWVNFFRKMQLFSSMYKYVFFLNRNISEIFFEKFIILIIVSVLFGNIFLNYSFILSAVGASCAEICSIMWICVGRCQLKFFLGKLAFSPFFKEIMITMLTSLAVGILLAPLTSNSFMNSCVANVIAIPFITFVVTPLALLVLVFPSENILFDYIIHLLDYSLAIFKYIGSVFSEEKNLSSLNNKSLFSADGLLYLNLIMIFLFVSIDIIRSRKLDILRIRHSLFLSGV